MSLSARFRGGTGRPIVVLPWLGVDGAFAAAALEPALAASGRRRVYVDLPGTGRLPACQPSSDAVADVLADWVRGELGTQRFSVVGFSYGGYLAAAVAGRLGEQIERLMLVCGGVKIVPGERDLSGVLGSDPEAGWLDEVPTDLHDHFRDAVGVQSAKVASRLAAAFREGATGDEEFLSALRARYRLSAEGSITRLPHRVTFVAGRRDRIVGFRDQFDASLGCPNGDYILLGAAGHYLPFEVPEVFQAVATEWLA